MSGNLPFGFTPPGDDDDRDGGSGGPTRSSAPVAPAASTRRRSARRSSSSARCSARPLRGPVNWKLARDTRTQRVVAARATRRSTPTERREVEEALDLAELWLDPVTSFPASGVRRRGVDRSEWIEETLRRGSRSSSRWPRAPARR